MSVASPEDWTLVWGAAVASTEEADPGRAIIETFWRDAFAAMQGVNHALEIGAGGAAIVARLMAERFTGAEIVASDFRDGASAPAPILYVGDAPIEKLPFPDQRFDLVAGQFAFEYASPDGAAAELARVTRGGGALRLLIHHAESTFSRTLPHRVDCLNAGALLYRAIQTPDAFLRKVRIRAALKQITALIEVHQARRPVLGDVLGDLTAFAAIARARLDGAKSPDEDLLALCAPSLRLTRAQAGATLSQTDIAQRIALLEQAGFTAADLSEVKVQGRPLAWALSMQR